MKKVIKKCKILLKNFLWVEKVHHARVKVNWGDCCAHKNIGGLGLIDPEDVLSTLLCKWVLLPWN
jgi:hypothetical protein